MQAWIEKRFYLVNLLVVGLSSGLVGLTVTNYAASKLLDQKPPRRPARPALADGSAGSKKAEEAEIRASQYDVIRRNLFCSYCVPAKPSAEPSDNGAEAAAPTVNMDDAELLATLIAKDDDRWSLATIRFKSSQRTRVVAMGSKLDDAEIVKVEARRVTFQKGAQTGYIDLLPGAAKSVPTPLSHPPAPGKSPGPPGATGFQAALEKGVRMIGPNKYEIDRSLVNEFIANANVASTDAAIFPHTRDGKPDGYRLGRVRPGGIFARLGLRSGDVVNSINNVDISSPDKLLGLYTQLPGSNHMTIGVTRYGKPVSIDYSIK